MGVVGPSRVDFFGTLAAEPEPEAEGLAEREEMVLALAVGPDKVLIGDGVVYAFDLRVNERL